MGDHGKVSVEVRDGICHLTLTDDAHHNVLSVALMTQLRDAMRAVLDDSSIRAVVITNRGKVFCAGADLKAAADQSAADLFAQLLSQIRSFPKPVIGRIAGHAFGGGIGLAATFDISLAAESATFGFSEVRLGVVPGVISVVCLPKMRRSDALEAFLRGHRFSAGEAARMGLITRAVAAEDLDAALNEVLADVRLGGPNALATAKRLVNEFAPINMEAAFSRAAELSAAVFASPEAREGTSAFREKRPPTWAS